MKLQQLKYIREVVKNDLNVSATAEAMFTSQPGISKQICMLEDELGLEVFSRSGKHLSHITPAGIKILEIADEIFRQVEKIKQISQEFTDENKGSLSIATTHTQARYVLPAVIEKFIARYPKVSLHMQQGTPKQIAEMAAKGEVDFAIATEALEHFQDLTLMPCYRWNRCVLVPEGHPLAKLHEKGAELTLEEVAKYPLVTYVFGFTGRSRLDEAFFAAGLEPKVVITAADADVIKTYVRLGLGIGIVASMACKNEPGLITLNASHLFKESITSVAFRKGSFLRAYMYDFIEGFAPHLNHKTVEAALNKPNKLALESLFSRIDLPIK
jgi:LysR family transcriptional regulator, cys regulon transcriptional activator